MPDYSTVSAPKLRRVNHGALIVVAGYLFGPVSVMIGLFLFGVANVWESAREHSAPETTFRRPFDILER